MYVAILKEKISKDEENFIKIRRNISFFKGDKPVVKLPEEVLRPTSKLFEITEIDENFLGISLITSNTEEDEVMVPEEDTEENDEFAKYSKENGFAFTQHK